MSEDESISDVLEESGLKTPPRKKRKVAQKKNNNENQLSKKKSKKNFVNSWFQISADISVLKSHMGTRDHILAMKGTSSTRSITQFVRVVDKSEEKESDIAVKNAEITLAAFFAEHNIPFRVFDHLPDMLEKCFPDSQIVKKITIKRTKGENIIKHVLGESEKSRLTRHLLVKKFSLMTDECTDNSTIKSSCVIVRFYDDNAGRIVSKFWDLVQVYQGEGATASSSKSSGATGKNLYENIITSLEKKGIPKENVIGFGSDGCSVMMGVNNSVASRLRENFPGITIFKCICHSLALVASNACKKLPRTPEELARLIYSYFNSSAKRQSEFIQFQTFANTEPHKLLQPAQTRWLSLTAVVERIVEQWNALKLYFNDQSLQMDLKSAEQIYIYMSDPFTLLYFHFLKWVLPIITNANKFFQSSKVVITELHEVMSDTYKTLLQSYMSDVYVSSTPLWKINPNNSQKFKPLNSMYLGVNVNIEKSKSVIQNQVHLLEFFHEKCQLFLIQACLEIKQRYDFEDPVLTGIKIFQPQSALSSLERERTPSLVPLLQNLPRVCDQGNYQCIDDEWRKLCLHNFEDEESMLKKDIDIFWGEVMLVKNGGGEFLFRHLAECVLAILSLPHSNCDSERIFSAMNRIKTNDRNQCSVSTVGGVLLAKQFVKANGYCTRLKLSNEEFSRMTADTLYPKSEKADCQLRANIDVIAGDERDDENIHVMFER